MLGLTFTLDLSLESSHLNIRALNVLDFLEKSEVHPYALNAENLALFTFSWLKACPLTDLIPLKAKQFFLKWGGSSLSGCPRLINRKSLQLWIKIKLSGLSLSFLPFRNLQQNIQDLQKVSISKNNFLLEIMRLHFRLNLFLWEDVPPTSKTINTIDFIIEVDDILWNTVRMWIRQQ